MVKQLRAIFIHGVGQQDAYFAHAARERLRDACEARGVAPFFLSCHWAPFADAAQNLYLEQVRAHGSAGNLTQRLSIGTLSDALMYQANPVFRARIFDLLDRQVETFTGHPFTIFAHSLGGLIATDWLRARSKIKNVTLVTMGCNIGVFRMGQNFETVPQLLYPNAWLNLFYRKDMLGWAVNVNPAQPIPYVTDFEIRPPWWRFTGAVHTYYWEDSALWSKTIPKLLAL